MCVSVCVCVCVCGCPCPIHGHDMGLRFSYCPAVRQDYERKRVSYAELRKTWQLANQHFVISQDQLNQRIYELEQRVAQGEGRGRVELLG